MTGLSDVVVEEVLSDGLSRIVGGCPSIALASDDSPLFACPSPTDGSVEGSSETEDCSFDGLSEISVVSVGF